MIKPTLPPSRPLFSAAVLLISLLSTACTVEQQQAAGPRAIPVKLQTLRSATLIDSSNYVGTLIDKNRVSLAPRIDGRILAIKTQPGAVVTQGQTLVTLEPLQQQEDVNAGIGNVNEQKARLSEQQANLRTLEAQRDATQAEVANRQAQIANSIANVANAQENLKRNDAELKQAEAIFNLDQINYDRSTFLVEKGVLAQQNLDDTNASLENSRARVQAASRSVEAARASVNASQASVNAAKAALTQAQKNVQAADQRMAGGRANINAQQAAIDRAQGQLGSVGQNLVFNFIKAPINGIVGNFDRFKVGDIVKPGDQITTISNNRLFDLNINIPTEYHARLKVGLPVEIINEDGSPGVRGQVTYVAPLIEQNAQAILTKVTFTSDGSLRDEQYVRVRVIWDTRPGVLVPTTAITTLGSQRFVFVAQPQKTQEGASTLVARQTPIKVGAIQGQAFQILSGVKPGDKIAVSRILDLKDETLITDESTVQGKAVRE